MLWKCCHCGHCNNSAVAKRCAIPACAHDYNKLCCHTIPAGSASISSATRRPKPEGIRKHKESGRSTHRSTGQTYRKQSYDHLDQIGQDNSHGSQDRNLHKLRSDTSSKTSTKLSAENSTLLPDLESIHQNPELKDGRSHGDDSTLSTDPPSLQARKEILNPKTNYEGLPSLRDLNGIPDTKVPELHKIEVGEPSAFKAQEIGHDMPKGLDYPIKLHESNDDDSTAVESIVSLEDSISSADHGHSSISSLPEVNSTLEQFVECFLANQGLRQSCEEAVISMGFERFMQSFSQLLKQYSSELRLEAKDDLQQDASLLIRSRRHYIATRVCFKINGSDRTMNTEQVNSLKSAKKDILERSLGGRLAEAKPEEIDSLSEQLDDSTGLNDDRRIHWPNINQVKLFLVQGSSFENLRTNLRVLMEPIEVERPPEASEPKYGAESMKYECNDSLPSTSREMHISRSSWRIRALNRFGRLFRPSVAKGARRLEWTCDCGREMYWDIQGISEGRFRYLKDHLKTPLRTTPDNNTTCSPTIPPTRALPESKTVPMVTTRQYNQSLYVPDSLPQNVGPSSATEPNEINVCRAQCVPQYIELCINIGIHSRILGEVNITDADSDGEMFQKITETYYAKRHNGRTSQSNALSWLGSIFTRYLLRWEFQKPASIIFRKFTLDGGPQVALGNPELPPECEVSNQRYEYRPCPLEANEVPMPDHQFFHLFFQPSGHDKSRWKHRLPKKLKESIFHSSNEYPVGWSIHIIEAPDFYIISAFVLFGLIVSGSISVIYVAITKDVQGGFGIGSYVATVQAAWMATVYFKWNYR